MKTLIITGGMIEADFALSFIQELKPDYILGVDKGLQFCYEYDIRPDYIVGDFDSLPGEILERYRQEGEIPIRTYNPVKDATDTKIALDKALEEGSTEIWILGATRDQDRSRGLQSADIKGSMGEKSTGMDRGQQK